MIETIPVTAIVCTRNEEANVVKCLEALRGLVREVFVIDSESEDRTAELARAHGARVHTLDYVHEAIIPWIFQWGLDNLPIQTEWVLIMEADRVVGPDLAEELRELFRRPAIDENGFYIRRIQVFRGRRIRFGGYGRKYLLTLFRRDFAELDVKEQDTRVYVRGKTGRLKAPMIEENFKEAEILFYLQKHLRYVEAFARDELERRTTGFNWKLRPSPLGTPDQRVLWMKSIYYRTPLYLRAFLYYVYRYVFRLGFLDGRQGAIFHFLQAFWFRLVVDIRLAELQRARAEGGATQEPRREAREHVHPRD